MALISRSFSCEHKAQLGALSVTQPFIGAVHLAFVWLLCSCKRPALHFSILSIGAQIELYNGGCQRSLGSVSHLLYVQALISTARNQYVISPLPVRSVQRPRSKFFFFIYTVQGMCAVDSVFEFLLTSATLIHIGNMCRKPGI